MIYVSMILNWKEKFKNKPLKFSLYSERFYIQTKLIDSK